VWFICCVLFVACCKLHVACCMLHVDSHVDSHVAFCMLHVACCVCVLIFGGRGGEAFIKANQGIESC
jgi:hypothetical protein